jgi:hypothetical protein
MQVVKYVVPEYAGVTDVTTDTGGIQNVPLPLFPNPRNITSFNCDSIHLIVGLSSRTYRGERPVIVYTAHQRIKNTVADNEIMPGTAVNAPISIMKMKGIEDDVTLVCHFRTISIGKITPAKNYGTNISRIPLQHDIPVHGIAIVHGLQSIVVRTIRAG